MSRWRGANVSRSLRASLSVCGSSASGAARNSSEILQRLDPPPAAAAKGVHDLVARYGVDPGRERLRGVPGMALEMDRQQGLLHCILDVRVPNPSTRKSASRHCPHRPTDVLKQPPIRALIPRDRGGHHPRPTIVLRTPDGLSFHVGFVSFRLPLQVPENRYFARNTN